MLSGSLAWRTKFFVWILISRGCAKVNLTNVIYFQNTETGRKCLWKLWESASEGIRKLCYDTVRKQGQGRLTENVWGPMFWAFYHSESQMHMWLKNKKNRANLGKKGFPSFLREEHMCSCHMCNGFLTGIFCSGCLPWTKSQTNV